MAGSQNQIKIVINGTEIPCPSSYTFVDAKSYGKEPTRSATGVIDNLDAYATFLTPRLRFEFKYMPIAAYRILMKLIKMYNEFTVTVYDIVEDKYVTHRMYFYPKEFPEIFTKGLDTLAVLNESFELVGTNAQLEEIKITYSDIGYGIPNTDGTETILNEYTTFYSGEFKVGQYDADSEYSTIPLEYNTRGTYHRNGWIDDSGIRYMDNVEILVSTDFALHPYWVAGQ